MIVTSQIRISTMFLHANQNNQEKADMKKQIAGLTYKCPECSITFDQWKDLKIHNKNKKPEMQTCRFCSFKSCTFLDMENHTNSTHENEMNNVEKSAMFGSKEDTEPESDAETVCFSEEEDGIPDELFETTQKTNPVVTEKITFDSMNFDHTTGQSQDLGLKSLAGPKNKPTYESSFCKSKESLAQMGRKTECGPSEIVTENLTPPNSKKSKLACKLCEKVFTVAKLLKRHEQERCPKLSQDISIDVKNEESYFNCPICNVSTNNCETINCEHCNNWYHFKCANVTSNDARVQYEEVPYYCSKCEVQMNIKSSSLLSDNQVFEVEAIIQKRSKKEKIEYLVKWAGYTSEHNTWEPSENIKDPRLIQEFLIEDRNEELSDYEKQRAQNIQDMNSKITVKKPSVTPKPNKKLNKTQANQNSKNIVLHKSEVLSKKTQKIQEIEKTNSSDTYSEQNDVDSEGTSVQIMGLNTVVSNSETDPSKSFNNIPTIVNVSSKKMLAIMDTTKFKSGGKGKCIQLGKEWLTPSEFERQSGARARKYKSSIKCLGRPLGYFIENGRLSIKLNNEYQNSEKGLNVSSSESSLQSDQPTVDENLENSHKSEMSTKETQGKALVDKCINLNSLKGKGMSNYENIIQSKANEILLDSSRSEIENQKPAPEDQPHKIVKKGPKSKINHKVKLSHEIKMRPKSVNESPSSPQPSSKPKSPKSFGPERPKNPIMGTKSNTYPRLSPKVLIEDQKKTKSNEVQPKPNNHSDLAKINTLMTRCKNCREKVSKNGLNKHIEKCNKASNPQNSSKPESLKSQIMGPKSKVDKWLLDLNRENSKEKSHKRQISMSSNENVVQSKAIKIPNELLIASSRSKINKDYQEPTKSTEAQIIQNLMSNDENVVQWKAMIVPNEMAIASSRSEIDEDYQEQGKPTKDQPKPKYYSDLTKINIEKCNNALKQGTDIETIDISDDEIDIKQEKLIELPKVINGNIAKLGYRERNVITANPFIESSQPIDVSLALPDPKIQNTKEPAPLIVEFYSCPASNRQKPCPKYETEEKVRQHIEFFHKISMEQQMQFFKTIQKQVL